MTTTTWKVLSGTKKEKRCWKIRVQIHSFLETLVNTLKVMIILKTEMRLVHGGILLVWLRFIFPRRGWNHCICFSPYGIIRITELFNEYENDVNRYGLLCTHHFHTHQTIQWPFQPDGLMSVKILWNICSFNVFLIIFILIKPSNDPSCPVGYCHLGRNR